MSTRPMQYIREDGTKRLAKDSKNDRYQEMTQGANPGKSKAQATARVVGGKAVLPVFGPGEADYPAGLDPITPQSYREHLRASKAL